MIKQTVYRLDPEGDFIVSAIDRIGGNRVSSRANMYVLSKSELEGILRKAWNGGYTKASSIFSDQQPMDKEEYIAYLLKQP